MKQCARQAADGVLVGLLTFKVRRVCAIDPLESRAVCRNVDQIVAHQGWSVGLHLGEDVPADLCAQHDREILSMAVQGGNRTLLMLRLDARETRWIAPVINDACARAVEDARQVVIVQTRIYRDVGRICSSRIHVAGANDRKSRASRIKRRLHRVTADGVSEGFTFIRSRCVQERGRPRIKG